MADYDLGRAHGTIILNAASLGKAQVALRTMGLALLGIGALAIAGFGVAVNKAADFEKNMSAVQAVLGVTDKAMEKVKEKALELGATTVFSALQVSEAMEDLAKAGLNIEEIVGGAADATVQLAAAAGNIGLDRAAEIAANAMRTFDLSAEEVIHVADVLAGAANASTVEIEDLAVSMRYAGPVAKTAGLNIQEFNTALAVLGDRGIKGSTAGTSLRGVLLSLSPTAGKARDMMEELGFITEDGGNKFFDASGKMKSMGEVMQILQDGFKGLTKEQQINAAKIIFQRRAMASALVLAGQGAAGFDKYTAAIERVSAADVAATKLDNLRGDITLLKSAIETALIKAGTPFQEMLRGWVQGLTTVVRWFANLSPATQELILKIIAITGVVFTFAGMLLLLMATFIKVQRILIDFRAALTLFRAAMAASFVTSGPFLIIAALVLLGLALFALYKKSETFRNIVQAAWEGIQAATSAAWNFIRPILLAIGRFFTQTLPDAFFAARDAIASAFGSVRDFLAAVWDGVVSVFQSVIAALSQGWDAISGPVLAVGAAIASFTRGSVRQLKILWRWIGQNVLPIFQELGALGAAIFGRLSTNAQVGWKLIQPVLRLLLIGFKTTFGVAVSVVQLLLRTVQHVFGLLSSVISTGVSIALAILTTAFNTMAAVVEVAFGIIREAIGVFLAIVGSVWGPFWDNFSTIVGAVFDVIVAVVEAALGVLKGIIQIVTGIISGDWKKAWEGVKTIFAGVWNLIKTIVSSAITIVKSVISNGLDAVINFFKRVPGRIVEAIGNVASLLFRKGTDIVRGLFDGLRRIWSEVREFFQKLPGMIIDFIGDVSKILFNIGKKIIGGLIDGIKDAVGGGLKDAVSGIGSLISSWKGPENYDKKLLVPAGKWIMEGLTDGLSRGLQDVRRLMEDTTNLLAGVATDVPINLTPVPALSAVGAGVLPSSRSITDSPVHVVEKTGDTFMLEAKTDASPEEIMDEYFWAKRVRGG